MTIDSYIYLKYMYESRVDGMSPRSASSQDCEPESRATVENRVKQVLWRLPAACLVVLMMISKNSRAADKLSDGCFTDLEASISELEAALAKRTNPKLSVTISGYVAKQILFYDDGIKLDSRISDVGATQASNFRISGQSNLTSGWSAGYLMRIQDLSADTFGLSQVTARSNKGLNVQMSYWYLSNRDLGKLSIGRNALADKSAAMFTDQSGTQVVANSVLFDGSGFFVQHGDLVNKSIRWGDIGFCYSQARTWGGDCNGIVMNGIRYDSPSIGGLVVSGSWGEDDTWSVAGRFSNEAQGFELSTAVAYASNTDESLGERFTSSKSSEFFQAGAYIEHSASGLFLHGLYGREDNGNAALLAFPGHYAPDSHHWYVKGGLRSKWIALGHTVLFSDYGAYVDQLGPRAIKAGAITGELTRFGGGIVQEIDAAAMSVWLRYDEMNADIVGGPLLNPDAIRFVHMGALINF